MAEFAGEYFGTFEFLRTAEPAKWLANCLPRGHAVKSVVPAALPRHARLFHPLQGPDIAPMRWSDVVAPGAVRFDSLLSFEELMQCALPVFTDRTVVAPANSLSISDVTVLTGLLAAVGGSTQSVFCAAWSGTPSRVPSAAATIVLLGNAHWVMRGALASLNQSQVVPELWWPESHEWVVGRGVGMDSTYLAGDESLISAVIGSDNLEAVEASPDDDVPFWVK